MVTRKKLKFKNKKVLITAGPTWVAIDKVRVISNIATGETGILLAEKLKDLGAKVTLLLGPCSFCCPDKKIRLIRFKFFDELKKLVEQELKYKRYDIVIHSAAVSDYKPARFHNCKVESGLGNFRINLVPTLKIINLIKRISPDSLAVGFKFEPQADKASLAKKAKGLLKQAGLDLVVANSIKQDKYLAYIIGCNEFCGPILNKKIMANKLVKLL